MRIMLTGKDVAVTEQLRAYAEYRMFTSIARYEPLVRAVNVTLRRHTDHQDRFLCLVSLDLSPSGQITTRASAPHPNVAIDRVADRVASLLGQRVPRHVSS